MTSPENENPHAIAIVGMAGRFPGAKDVAAFWENLKNGVESISHFSDDELEFSVATSGESTVKARAVLEDADLFDADFFGIYPREAELMDPQHRVFLECAWHALEDAGCDPETFPGLIGTFAGLSINSYLLFNLCANREFAARFAGGYPTGDYHTLTGNDKDFLPTRVAYKLNLKGPAIAVQSACSTSLVAVAQACQNLLTFNCDVALAGGVSITFPQKRDYLYTPDGMVSADGCCRTFDANAKGTVFGHGAGVVVLKRLAEAVADGDHVYAVIKGFATNNDGSDKVGYAAPGVNGQADVIAMAQANAGVEPDSISYIEAHGTGTPLGDPIEIAALTKAFRLGTDRKHFCAIGTAKTNIGHLDIAAGVTGLIKTALSLENRLLPPLLHFEKANPEIDFENSPFYPVQKLTDWKSEGPLRAGVSAFGIGGTNAHLVLEEAPAPEPGKPERGPHMLILSAKTSSALEAMRERLATFLETHREISLADVAFTLQTGRRAFEHRTILFALNVDDAIRFLRAPDMAASLSRRIAPRAATPATGGESAAELAQRWLGGEKVDWSPLHAGKNRRRVSLPLYPFERKRFWVEPAKPAGTDAANLSAPVASRMNTPATPPAPAEARQERLCGQVVKLVSDLSGMDVSGIAPDASFLELGFDSLFLTQASTALQKQFGVKITFRQLLADLTNAKAIAGYLDAQLPADTATEPVAAPSTASSPSPTGNAPLDRILAQQQQIFNELQALKQSGGSEVSSARKTRILAPAPAEGHEQKRFGPYKPLEKGAKGGLTSRQQEHLDKLIARYTAKTAGSKKFTAENRPHLADPRAVSGFKSNWKEMIYPIVTERSTGAKLWDIDGNDYVDITNGFGLNFFGWSPKFVNDAVREQLELGIEIGPQSALAGKVAKLITEFTGMERVTFCNTGSEAVMAAMRVARTVTGRSKVALFTGGYHGTFDEVLVRALHKDGELHTAPIAPGIPDSVGDNIVVLEYGAPQSLEILRAHADEFAAVLVEPVQSRRPDLQPREFLQEIRAITGRSGSALIFDEVVTGFRCHPGGAQAHFGIRADLATYGKVVGGGLPIGILAGSAKFMDALDGGAWNYGDDSFPEIGMTFFAGTFVRHPLALAAAWAVLNHLKSEGPGLQLKLNARVEKFACEMEDYFEEIGVPIRLPHFASWFMIEYPADLKLGSLLWFYLRERGVHVWEHRPCFLTLAHTEADFDFLTIAFKQSVSDMQAGGFLPESPAQTVGTEIAPVPLTEAQREIWLSTQMGDDANCAYNEMLALHLDGALDEARLRRALRKLVRNHDALRSTFDASGETQHFATKMEVATEVLDLSQFEDAARDARVAEIFLKEARTPFDLVRGPLFRTCLVKLAGEKHALILSAHHIVCDGWSFGTLLHELAALYSHETVLTAMQFREYAELQLREKSGEEVRQAGGYWVAQFPDIPEPLELPTDRPRPAVKSYSGSMETRALDLQLFANLKKATAKRGNTVFATLFAAFNTLLHRLSGQNDIVVGIPAAGQSIVGSEADNLVGHCLNFLPVRTRLAGDAKFDDFAAATSKTVLDAYEHQNYTFGTLLQKLKLPRDTSRLPLVNVMFNIDKAGYDKLKFGGVSARVTTIAKRFVNFDIFFNLVQTDAEMLVQCEFNTDLFDNETIRRWLAHFETLIAGIVENGGAPVAKLPLLSDAEREKILVEWNDTRADFPADKTLHALIEEQAVRTPNAIAVVFGNQQLTYAELNSRADALASELRRRGLKPGALAGVCVERSTDMIVAVLGVLKTGAAYVPMDPAFPAERLAFMIEDARMPAIVTQRALSASLPAHGAELVFVDGVEGRNEASVDAGSGSDETKGDPANAPAYVIFTSGSTGRPKGVEISHRAVVNFLNSMRKTPGLTGDDILLAITTLSFDIAGLEIFLPLVCGARVVVASREIVMDGVSLKHELARCGATVMQATPVTWRMLLEAGWEGDPKLKMLIGGEAVPRDLANVLVPRGASLWNMYGPTETTIWSAVHRIEAGDEPVLIGRPIDNTQIYIVDAQLQPVPVGVAGELLIGGDGLARGYLNRLELTAEKFIASPFAANARLYKTGDLAKWLADGTIECLGRIDNQVKLRGFRIELGEIETLLEKHPAVEQAVVSVHDGRLVAYLRSATRSGADGTAIWQDQWDLLYRSAIDQTGSEKLDRLDSVIAGWAGAENIEDQVSEWIDITVDRIRNYDTRRIFEIGCGTGQILARLAATSECYWAADISNVAIEALGNKHPLPQVKLFHRPADDFSEIPNEHFDTVIINSVAQYFPNADYLARVLEGAARVLKPGGRIFLGDLQGSALLATHHAEVLRERAPTGVTAGQLRESVARRVALETELSIDPAWFDFIPEQIPCLTHIETLLRRGKLANETTRYHYDLILHKEPSPSTFEVAEQMEWKNLNLEQLEAILDGATAAVRLTGIPDARLASAIAFHRALQAAPADAPLPAIPAPPPNAVSAEELFAVADHAGFKAHVRWHGDGTDGMLNVIFSTEKALPVWNTRKPSGHSSAYANTPHAAAPSAAGIAPALRSHLAERLPDYMIPSAFVVLESFPLTPNGKVDRKALPAPSKMESAPALRRVVGARNDTEAKLLESWKQVLGKDDIGVEDDIFELGGDSILIFQITTRATRAGLAVTPAQVFRLRTVAALAAASYASAEKPVDTAIHRVNRDAYRRKI